MAIKKALIGCCLLLFQNLLANATSNSDTTQYWELNQHGIVWRIGGEQNLPHHDNLEMSGKLVSAIIHYQVNEAGEFTMEKDLIFPQLRTFNKTDEPDWKKYRAYFRRKVTSAIAPTIVNQDKVIRHHQVDSVMLDGKMTIYYQQVNGLRLTKVLYPSMNDRLLVEEWHLTNVTSQALEVSVGAIDYRQTERGYKGNYTFVVTSNASDEVKLSAGEQYVFPVYYGALLNEEQVQDFSFQKARASRDEYLKLCRQQLVLKTPDPALNTMFYFAKLRAAESIFESSMGLVHSPGGGNYYVGIWANDQVEYSVPFFPLIGYRTARTAAYNTYQKFLDNIPEDDGHIAYAFEVDGNFPMTHLDRGDAAMIAYGTSLYLLNAGDRSELTQLWPLITWSLSYCHRMRNAAGAVMSESDEMEGRIPTGDANLSTSTLYYGGLKYASMLARELGKERESDQYADRASEMEQVIEQYFGANVEGLETYRYYDGNEKLRHWICLPLTMGITQRKEATLEALFGKMWTANGVLVEYDASQQNKQQTFWDRATLYALRGALRVGAAEAAMEKLKAYSSKRLLGDHVPYAVEAYPENNMKHLSAESALYARIYLEGIFGISPVGFGQFAIQPSLPQDWAELSLEQVYLAGKPHDIMVSRERKNIRVQIKYQNKLVVNRLVREGKPVYLNIKK